MHGAYKTLWPIETDILQLLPKPDGRPRAVYTGSLHPQAIMDFALGSPLYFGQVLIVNPFVHTAHVRPEFSPIENPRAYHQDFVKTVYLFLALMPLVEAGYLNLVPDPTVFDLHLHEQMLHLAQARSKSMKISIDAEGGWFVCVRLALLRPSSETLSQSPAIRTSFLARLQPLIWRSAAKASPRVGNS